MSSVGKLEGLQVLRGVAAFLVLWAHLKFALGEPDVSWVKTAVGAVGVDIFFVLSGFIIMMSASRRDFGAWEFLKNRFIRIAPLYYVVGAVLLVRYGVGAYAWRSIFNVYGFLPVFDVGVFVNPFVPGGWSLSFEFLFYFVFAGLIAVVGGVNSRSLLPLVFLVSALVGTLLFVAFPLGNGWFFPRFITSPMTVEFAAGCVLYQIFARGLVFRVRYWAIALMLSLPLLFVSNKLGYHNEAINDPVFAWSRVFCWGVPATLLLGLFLGLEQSYAVRWPRLLIRLGDMSYSLYLTHFVAVAVVVKISLRVSSWWVLIFAYLSLSIVVAYFTYRFIELPFSAFLKRILNFKKKKA